jgi:hypothetical protein
MKINWSGSPRSAPDIPAIGIGAAERWDMEALIGLWGKQTAAALKAAQHIGDKFSPVFYGGMDRAGGPYDRDRAPIGLRLWKPTHAELMIAQAANLRHWAKSGVRHLQGPE